MFSNILSKKQLRCIVHLLQRSSFSANGVKQTYICSKWRKSLHHYWANGKGSVNNDSRAASTINTAEIVALASNADQSTTDEDSETSGLALKYLLYDEVSDKIIAKLNCCRDIKQLLNCLKDNSNQLKHQHYIHSILTMRTFLPDSENDIKEALLDHILCGLQPHIREMDISEQSCCYLYLRKIGVPNTNIVVQKLLTESLSIFKSTPLGTPIALPVLSRLAVGINTGHDFHIATVCSSLIPYVMAHIEQCNNDNDVRLLAICVINLQPLITMDILDTFKAKLEDLINRGVISIENPSRTIVKLLQMLNLSIWSQHNGPLIRELLLMLQPNLSKLNFADLKMTSRIFSYHLEPAALIEPLSILMDQLFHSQHTPDVLAAYVPFLEPHRRESVVRLFKDLVFSSECWKMPHAAVDFFQIIRTLKISDVKICNKYWNNVLNIIESCPEESNLLFLRHIHRYMHFNNNLGGTYRFLPLEQRITQMAMQAIEHDVAGRIPTQFANLAAFVLAYGHTAMGWKKFPNLILSKIISMSGQFNAMDCFVLSRGLHIALELRFRNNVTPLLGMQLTTIDSVLTDCAERYLENKSLSVSELNTIVRTLGYRKALKNKTIYQEALDRYKQLNYGDLNSRGIREMTFNFNASNYTSPASLEAMFNYIVQHHEHIIGDTVEKVLTCSYNLGYTPQSETALEYAALILKRDFKYMSGLSIVQACLALCYYKSIPEDLIDMVFCVKFIQRIEEEIHMCYSKATYPERVLNLIMQLNRTVCLDYPEANVPWFQQNYLEAQLSKKLKVESKFSEDVKKLLAAVLNDKNLFSCNHITPYGYQIDFVIHFDRNRKPIAAPAETTILDRITKVAILLLRLDSFCENDLTALRGPEHLRTKHLEMMGYKVLHINEHDWNTRYMNTPAVKANYLKCLLQI